MIDSHTHLNSPHLFVNWKQHILEFEKIGGVGLINIGADDEYNNNGLEISKQYNGKIFVKCTVGYHPFEVVIGNINKENINIMINKLELLYENNKKHIVAIGEAGIDNHYGGNINLKLQKKLLELQCNLANKLQLPIVIHSRDAFDETMEVLEKYKQLKIYFHCWGYGTNEIQKIQNFGFKYYWIGFCGNITYPRSKDIKNSLGECNLNNILLETDAPYLPPQVFRGQKNYPKNIELIYEFVAKEKNIKKSELIKYISDNFQKLYKKKNGNNKNRV